MMCDKLIICVVPCTGLQFNAEYRAMKETGDSIYILNDHGSYKWYNKSRFVEKGVMQ